MKNLPNIIKYSFLWYILLFSFFVNATNKNIQEADGLKSTLLPNHKNKLYENLEMLRQATTSIDSAKAYSNISSVYMLSTYYLKTPHYDSIIYYSDKIIALTENKESKEHIEQYLSAISSKGVAYKDLGNLAKSLDYFKIVITETENISNPNYYYHQRQNATTLIAGVYAIQKNYEFAIKQYDNLFKYVDRKKIDTTLISSIVHLRYTRFSRELKNMEIALEHAKKAMAIAKTNNSAVREAMVCLEIAHIYVDTNKLTQATTFLERAFKILNAKEKYMNLRSKYYYLKAIINEKTNNISEKIHNAEKAFKLLSKTHITNWHADTANLLYNAYKERGFYKKANAILEEIVLIEKTISNKEQLKKSTLFEIERRDKNIALAEAKNKTMNQIVFCIILLFIMSVMSALYIHKDRRKKIKFANEISEKNKQLEQLDKVKSNFFSNITHELQTPLTLIAGPIEQVLNEGEKPLDPITKGKLQMVMNNTNALKTLINDILDLSKLEAKKLRLNAKSTDLDMFLNTTARKFIPLTKQKDISFEYCFKDLEGFHAIVDTKKLEKTLNNLLSNAIKYTPQNGTISVKGILAKNNQLQIVVKDTGVGISAIDIPQIFDRYFQSNDISKPLEGGSGIGLSLAKELVELMNGKITVESELSKGSTFTVTLPIEKATSNLPESYSNVEFLHPDISLDHLVLETEFVTKEYTILIVEDHTGMQEFITSILQKRYKLLIANNGKEALEKLKTNTVDLIVSDVMMPVMDGFTLLETLKQSETAYDIPVIMLTALSEINYKLKALTIGADDYLTKPFVAKELLARTHNLLERYVTRKKIKAETIAQENALEELLTGTDHETNILTSIGIEKQTKTDKELITKVAKLIEQNIDNPDFKLNDLTEELFLGERQLRRKIKLITGLSPKKFQQEIQLLKARTLLEEDAYCNTKAVALSIGMQNTTRFSKLYEARFGKHPADYFKT